jgi:hypothetical protein
MPILLIPTLFNKIVPAHKAARPRLKNDPRPRAKDAAAAEFALKKCRFLAPWVNNGRSRRAGGEPVLSYLKFRPFKVVFWTPFMCFARDTSD